MCSSHHVSIGQCWHTEKGYLLRNLVICRKKLEWFYIDEFFFFKCMEKLRKRGCGKDI